jgi:uncharacterized LabA/DUF88 family protein
MRNVPDTLTNERTALFIDYHNTQNALRRAGRQVDLAALRDYLAEGRHLLEAFLYIASHPQQEQQDADQANQQRLRQLGFLIRSKQGQMLPNGRLKCNFDLEMALDVQDFVARARPDIVVLVTGDGDFTPLAQRLRLQGVRVEVASTPGSISAALQAMASGFVDLAQVGATVDNLPILEPGQAPFAPLQAGGFDEDFLFEEALAPAP